MKIYNTIASTCGTGFKSGGTAGKSALYMYACAYYNCTTGVDATLNVNNMVDGTGTKNAPVSCSVDPFTNASGGDFSTNSTAGGGAAIRSVGFGMFNNSSAQVSYPDIGTLRHQDAGGGGTTYIFQGGE